MRPKLIVLEGIDNVGKSTCSELLVMELEKYGHPAVRLKTPPEQFREATLQMNTQASTDAHFLYHASMVKFAEEEAIRLLLHSSVVCDRWFYSTYAYHAAAGSKLALYPDSLVARVPDHAFLLTVSDDSERMRRALLKKSAEYHDLLPKSESPLLDRAEGIMGEFNLTRLDTSDLSEMEVVTQLFAIVVDES
jgi:thymidylate kinase